MNNHLKLYKLVDDINDFIFDSKYREDLEFYTLEFKSSGYDSAISFNGMHLMSESYYYTEIYKSIDEKIKLLTELKCAVTEFFSDMTNEEIEEMYGVGLDEGAEDYEKA